MASRHDLPARLPDEADELITGWRFTATMSPSTPLRVLRHHGEKHPKPASSLPCLTDDRSQGIWVPVTLTLRELGLDVDEPSSTMASPAGQVDPNVFLPFLIAYRTIIESKASPEDQTRALADMRSNAQWAAWLDDLGIAK